MLFGLWKSHWQKKYEDLCDGTNQLVGTWKTKYEVAQEMADRYERQMKDANNAASSHKGMRDALQASLDLVQGKLQKADYRIVELEAELKALKGQDVPKAPEIATETVTLTTHQPLYKQIEDLMKDKDIEPRIYAKNEFKKNKKHRHSS